MKKTLLLLVLVLSMSVLFGQNRQGNGLVPIVQKPVYFDVSPPLRDLENLPPIKGDHTWKENQVKNFFNVKNYKSGMTGLPNVFDESVQDYMGLVVTDTTLQNWQGITNPNGYYPPDTHGDVGPNHYFQVVNASYRIWNKTGTALTPVTNNSNVFSGLPNNSNDGDAVVLYDEQANRWLFTQFSLPNYPNGPFYQMIAVSQTPDPTGSWYRWQYSFTDMPDYPKFGVWGDGYYMSMNRFTASSFNYAGTGAVAFDRTSMLAGAPSPNMVLFTLGSSNEAYSFLPADCDGTFPATGTPNYFTYINEQTGAYHLRIYEFLVNWTTPASSTFGNYTTLTVNNFTTSGLTGVPQQGTSRKLDPLNDRLMYRLQFRKFNTYWAMVCNHTVNANVSGSNNAGIRWYELRKTTGAWSVYQQSTYAPDTKFRWMASMALDSSGNIALGYSISSSSMFPSIKYCGRMKNDALNTMSIAERGIVNGGGCQTVSGNPARWGDYSGLSVDPSAPATFWYTQEYYASTSSTQWTTRIASFSFLNTMSVTATAVPSTISIGQTSQLNVVATGGTPPYAYSWTSIPPGFTSNQQTPPVVSPVVNTKYIASVTAGTQTKTDTADVLVAFSVLAAANPTTVNSGQPSQLSATPAGGSGSYTYTWTSIPPGFSSNLQNPTVTPTQTTQYIISCNDGFMAALDTTTVQVAFEPLVIQASATPSMTCSGQSVQLSVTPTGGSSSYTYSWSSIPAGFTSNLQNPIAQPTVSTQFVVEVFDGFTTATDTTSVSVTPNPMAYAGADTTFCTWAMQIPLQGVASSYSTLLWTTSGTGTFSSTNSISTTYYPSSQDKNAGLVDLTLTSFPQSPCVNATSSTKHIAFDPCTGIGENESRGFGIGTTPNPSDGNFVLTILGVKNQNLHITVTDMEGKSIYSQKIRSLHGTLTHKLNLGTAAKGTYILKVQTSTETATEKIIVQ
jgi:hypothetical protein